MMFLTMELLRVSSFLLLFCCCSVFSFPSRPLNERSTELAWQAWLLVDDQQNQHKQSLSENFPRRRITPKSVFIAPTFSPESLPACADGYRPDSMGRCIKIIKLDEEAHLEFLLEKLNAQFGNYDDMEEESQENAAASGPFQLNIPLNGVQEEPTKQLDIAIVVAPTNGNFDLDESKTTTAVATTNSLGNSNTEKKILLPTEETPLIEETDNSKRKTDAVILPAQNHTEESTRFETTSGTTISIQNSNTTTSEFTETSTIAPLTSSSDLTTISITEETTIIGQHALFFLQPPLSNSEHVQNGTRNVNDTPLVTTGDDVNNYAPSNYSLTTFPSNSAFIIDASINLKNKVPSLGPDIDLADSTYTSQSEKNINLTTSSTNIVRFPLDDQTTTIVNNIKFPDQITKVRILPQTHPSDTLDTLRHPIYQTVFKGYLNPNGSNNLKGNDHFIFKDVTNLPSSLVSDPVNGNHNMHANYNQVFNHRNRDKNSNLWSIPTSWSQSSPKPILLRFSRRAINSRHLLSQEFESQSQNSKTFYREVPSEELSEIFGNNKNHNYKHNPR